MVTRLSWQRLYVRAEVEDAETELRVASEMKAASINLTKASLETSWCVHLLLSVPLTGELPTAGWERRQGGSQQWLFKIKRKKPVLR